MALTKEQKTKILSEYRVHKKDTGSGEAQIAMLTDQINRLSGHFEKHKKDHHSRFGLIRMVNKRKKLLTYLQRTNPEGYRQLITRLDLRK
jgi:small subunit ribosomal protein S15